MDNHPMGDGAIFQIDGNFGAAAALAEMLVQSQTDTVYLLPALPKQMKTGSVRGLRLRGKSELDMEWKDSKVTRVRIVSAGENIRLKDMAQITQRMVSKSVDAYVKQDLGIARQVIREDDLVDHLFEEVKNELVCALKDGTSSGEQSLDYLMIAKYYERIGDHATNIAEWVEFSITGQHEGE